MLRIVSLKRLLRCISGSSGDKGYRFEVCMHRMKCTRGSVIKCESGRSMCVMSALTIAEEPSHSYLIVPAASVALSGIQCLWSCSAPFNNHPEYRNQVSNPVKACRNCPVPDGNGRRELAGRPGRP